MSEFLIRCSSLSALMADPVGYPRESMSEEELAALNSKKRTAEQVAMLDAVMARTLSAGAKTEVHRLVRYHLFNYSAPELTGKEIKKGTLQEATAIDLLSIVTGEMYTKNSERRNNQWITGECDIRGFGRGGEIKCPWSLETFPLTSEEARSMAIKAGYHMQVAGYMMLWDLPGWTISYCMVDTPTELLPPWEDTGPHDLAGIPLSHLITQVNFERDLALEEKIKAKCEAAQLYAKELIKRFNHEHR